MLELRILNGRQALPLFDLPSLLGRKQAVKEVGDQIEALIEFMDALSGDPDLEDDDPAGDPLDERGEASSDTGAELLLTRPVYGVDQTRGPTNMTAAMKARQRWIMDGTRFPR